MLPKPMPAAARRLARRHRPVRAAAGRPPGRRLAAVVRHARRRRRRAQGRSSRWRPSTTARSTPSTSACSSPTRLGPVPDAVLAALGQAPARPRRPGGARARGLGRAAATDRGVRRRRLYEVRRAAGRRARPDGVADHLAGGRRAAAPPDLNGAIFERDGEGLVPTRWRGARGTRRRCTAARRPRCSPGRWSRAERPTASDGVARLTVELLRPVPLEPLVVRAEVVRPGRKVQLVEASLRRRAPAPRWSGPVPCASARRPCPCRTRTRCGARCSCPRSHRRRPETGVAERAAGRERRGLPPGRHRSAVRRGRCGRARPRGLVGPAARAAGGGRGAAPLQRTMALSDMGNGVSASSDSTPTSSSTRS